jgi:hypothetical protein
MAEPCFKKKVSNGLVCGVHNVPLTQQKSSDFLETSGLGSFTFFICPVSGDVVRDTQRKP